MTIPTTATAIAVYLALVVPGVVFVGVRVRMRGFVLSDVQIGSQLLLAFVVSVIFDAIYASAFGSAIVERVQQQQPPSDREISDWAFAYLGLAVGIPAVVAALIYLPRGPVRRLLHWVRTKSPALRFESTPTAWDLVTTQTTANWVRVRVGADEWVGGRFADQSYFSTYPEPRDLFIEESWEMSPQGEFHAKVPNSAGLWIAIQDHCIVEWVHAETDEEEIDRD
jgi:hypothetical protein